MPAFIQLSPPNPPTTAWAISMLAAGALVETALAYAIDRWMAKKEENDD